MTRNFWIELDVDDRAPIRAGPKKKDGGFVQRIFIREDEVTVKAVVIKGDCVGQSLTLRVTGNPNLRLRPTGTKGEFEITSIKRSRPL